MSSLQKHLVEFKVQLVKTIFFAAWHTSELQRCDTGRRRARAANTGACGAWRSPAYSVKSKCLHGWQTRLDATAVGAKGHATSPETLWNALLRQAVQLHEVIARRYCRGCKRRPPGRHGRALEHKWSLHSNRVKAVEKKHWTIHGSWCFCSTMA